MDSETWRILGVAAAFAALIGFVIFLTKQEDSRKKAGYDPDKDDLLGTGNLMIATQIKRDIAEIRMEVDKLADSAIRLNELSRETIEELRERAKGEPINSAEYRMLVRQVLKELQLVRNTHPDKDCEYLVGRAIRVLSQLTS